MTTNPEDAMTREQALEEAMRQHEKEARRYAAAAQESDEREDEPSMTEGGCARFIAETHRSAAATIRALASAQQGPAPAADAEKSEATLLRKRFAEYLVPTYLENYCLVAKICDEQLDRSGALLGYLREAAARAKSGEKDGGKMSEIIEQAASVALRVRAQTAELKLDEARTTIAELQKQIGELEAANATMLMMLGGDGPATPFYKLQELEHALTAERQRWEEVKAKLRTILDAR